MSIASGIQSVEIDGREYWYVADDLGEPVTYGYLTRAKAEEVELIIGANPGASIPDGVELDLYWAHRDQHETNHEAAQQHGLQSLTPGKVYAMNGAEDAPRGLTRCTWANGEGVIDGHNGSFETSGYDASDYFDADGRYLGPDGHGYEPLFDVAELWAACCIDSTRDVILSIHDDAESAAEACGAASDGQPLPHLTHCIRQIGADSKVGDRLRRVR